MWVQKVLFFIAGAVAATMCIYWYLDEIRPGMQETKQTGGSAQLANPASVNCVQTLGGTLEITDATDGSGQVGYCHLKDGRVCEEWSLVRGGCTAPQ